MASPQKENGYTPIANELLEALAKINLSGTHFAMIFVVMRKTYGFQKKEDSISIDQFVKMLGVSRRTVIYSIQDLEAKRILFVRRSRKNEKNNVNIISLNKDYEKWVVQNSAPQVENNRAKANQNKKSSSAKLQQQEVSGAKLSNLVVQNYAENVQSFAPTKETLYTKETLTKETIRTSVSFGELGMVKLTDDEYGKLCEKLGKSVADSLIEELDLYISSKGARYKSHYATVLGWARRRVNEHHARRLNRGKGII